MTILITGADGFIGRRPADVFESEADIRALVRLSRAMLGEMASDLLGPVFLRTACAGVETIFHCMGQARAFASEASEIHWHVNFEGMRNLLRVVAFVLLNLQPQYHQLHPLLYLALSAK